MLSTMEKTARLRTFASQNYKKFDECMKIFTRAELYIMNFVKVWIKTIICWNTELWFSLFYNEIFIGKKQL